MSGGETKTLKLFADIEYLSYQDLDDLPERRFISKRLNIERGTLQQLTASGSSGKTMLCQAIALCATYGMPLFKDASGQPVVDLTDCRVLLIDNEQSKEQTQRRFIRLANGYGVKYKNIARTRITEHLDHFLEYKQEEYLVAKEATVQGLSEIFKSFDLVLIDSLSRIKRADENSDKMTVALSILKEVAERTDAAVVIIHHKGKSTTANVKQTGRGHSSAFDVLDGQMDLDRTGTLPSDYVYTITPGVKMRDYVEGSTGPIHYKLVDEGPIHPKQMVSLALRLELVSQDKVNPIDIFKVRAAFLCSSRKEMTRDILLEETKSIELRRKDKLACINELIGQEIIAEERSDKGKAKLLVPGDCCWDFLEDNGVYQDMQVNNRN